MLAKCPQGAVDGVVAHVAASLRPLCHAAKDRPGRAGERIEVFENGHRLAGQGRQMRRRAAVALHPFAHLHLFGRAAQQLLFEIHILPVGQAYLARPLKEQRG